jgi:hypothetical protein
MIYKSVTRSNATLPRVRSCMRYRILITIPMLDVFSLYTPKHYSLYTKKITIPCALNNIVYCNSMSSTISGSISDTISDTIYVIVIYFRILFQETVSLNVNRDDISPSVE